MRTNVYWSMILVLGALGLGTGDASALPPDQDVVIRFRADPLNPGSPVVLEASLRLSAKGETPGSVGWSIQRAQFTAPGGGVKWLATNVAALDSADGLWWVQHASPQTPVIDEFAARLPSISGQAASNATGQQDLVFQIAQGQPNPATPSNTYRSTAFSDYRMNLAGDDEPIAEGDDEPVEVDNEADL